MAKKIPRAERPQPGCPRSRREAVDKGGLLGSLIHEDDRRAAQELEDSPTPGLERILVGL